MMKQEPCPLFCPPMMIQLLTKKHPLISRFLILPIWAKPILEALKQQHPLLARRIFLWLKWCGSPGHTVSNKGGLEGRKSWNGIGSVLWPPSMRHPLTSSTLDLCKSRPFFKQPTFLQSRFRILRSGRESRM